MITSLRLTNFKNFADETLRIGPFTVIVGTNASGKSNIRDAFRFLHGIGRGYTLAEILGGKYGAGGQIEWAGIRGATDEIIRFRQTQFSIHVQIRNLNYSITVSTNEENPGIFRVTREELKRSWETIYTSHPTIGDPVRLQDDDTHLLLRMAKTGEQRKYGHRIMVRPNQPALTQIREHQRVVRSHKGLVEQVINVIANMRFLGPRTRSNEARGFPRSDCVGRQWRELANSSARDLCGPST